MSFLLPVLLDLLIFPHVEAIMITQYGPHNSPESACTPEVMDGYLPVFGLHSSSAELKEFYATFLLALRFSRQWVRVPSSGLWHFVG